MTAAVPDHPKIYHILHVDKLAPVLAEGRLYSDAEVRRRALGGTTVGMQKLKEERLALPVTCHPGTMVGDYVPFYFCARSVMLYLLHRGNHENLAYRGGQDPIVTLEADLRTVVTRADARGRRWAFSLGNASARYQEFRADLGQLHEIRWDHVAARQWSASDVKEGKQAEFLVHKSFPWSLVQQIGVNSVATRNQVVRLLDGAAHRPPVHVKRDWYY
ncbi:type II toxin-antitoxin system toxin DNA ADP-ribosyl transferase DarT [Roseomonas rosulenta]|uniref:type II toxin-antitoxin system toxin DNA ADP-ribosyl transferase DarT n=1 Tax=Roseomonas rosulenta TaxID=2748667 RepID=UPI0018DF4D3B